MEEIAVNEHELCVQGIDSDENKNFLKEKYKEIDKEKIINISDNKKFYYAGMRRLFHLVEKLNPSDKEKFWKEFNVIDLLFDINNVRVISSILMKFFFQTDCEVEALSLIVTDFYKKIYTRIKREN